MCASGSDYLQHPAVFTVYNPCIITELCLVQEKQQNQGVLGIAFFVLSLCLVLCQTEFHHQPFSSDRLMYEAIYSECQLIMLVSDMYYSKFLKIYLKLML